LQSAVLNTGFDGFNLQGLGRKIGLWENGKPRVAHEMFRTTELIPRIEYAITTPLQNNTIFRHATHIAGTLIGNQVSPSFTSPNNSIVRGVSYKSTIKAWDWFNVPYEMGIAATSDNIKIANTSFGYNPLYLHAAEFGRYNQTAKDWDVVMCANNEFQIVKSAGNARDDLDANHSTGIYPQVTTLNGYDLLEGAGIAKNVLVVGSVNLSGSTQTNGSYNGNAINEPYSSWGPTDDGRIKPDLVSHGNNVLSSFDTQNNTYGLYSGTSQAAAGVTGGITLLQEYWKRKFSNEMWSSTARALLIHSADEIDERGPDYRNGWGVVNIKNAAELIKKRGQSVIIREDYLNNTDRQTFNLNIAASGLEDLKITIAWTDPAGNVTAINTLDPLFPDNYINEITPKLVNDIDIRLLRSSANSTFSGTLIDGSLPSPNNNVLFPWIMRQEIGPVTPPSLIPNVLTALNSIAVRGDNTRDNVEKIEVYKHLTNLGQGGLFQLQISHKGTLINTCGNGQRYTLIVSGASICSNNLVFWQHQDDQLTDGLGTRVLANSIQASNIIRSITTLPSGLPSGVSFSTINPDFVEYKAADFIELLPQSQNNGISNLTEGFTAEFGSDFLAHTGCDTIHDFNQRMAFSADEINAILKDEKVEEKVVVAKGEMVVFPNPLIDDILHLQFTLIEASVLSINIYDISGKLIFTDESQKIYDIGTSKKTIDLNRLPTGTYILQTKTKDGDRQIKFIKK
jgi:hypothetical protein